MAVLRVTRVVLCVVLTFGANCLLLFTVTSGFYHPHVCPHATPKAGFTILFPTCGRSGIVVPTVCSFLRRSCPQRLCSVVIVSSRVRRDAGRTLQRLPIHLLVTSCASDSGTGTVDLTVGTATSVPCSTIIVVSTSGATNADFLSRLGPIFRSKTETIRTRHATGGAGASVTILSTTDRRVGGSVFHDKRVTLKLSSALVNSNVTLRTY